MNNEQINHLVNLLELNIERLENCDSSIRLLSEAQREDAIRYDKDMINKLKAIL